MADYSNIHVGDSWTYQSSTTVFFNGENFPKEIEVKLVAPIHPRIYMESYYSEDNTGKTLNLSNYTDYIGELLTVGKFATYKIKNNVSLTGIRYLTISPASAGHIEWEKDISTVSTDSTSVTLETIPLGSLYYDYSFDTWNRLYIHDTGTNESTHSYTTDSTYTYTFIEEGTGQSYSISTNAILEYGYPDGFYSPLYYEHYWKGIDGFIEVKVVELTYHSASVTMNNSTFIAFSELSKDDFNIEVYDTFENLTDNYEIVDYYFSNGTKIAYATDTAATVVISTNNQTITKTIDITIEKAIPEYTIPSYTADIKNKPVLSDFILTEGFSFSEYKEFPTVGEYIVKAVYTPKDLVNYQIVEDIPIPITINRNFLSTQAQRYLTQFEYSGCKVYKDGKWQTAYPRIY